MPLSESDPASSARGQVLSNARLVAWFDARGRSHAVFDGLALTRSTPPGFGASPGMAWYVRDLASAHAITLGPASEPGDPRAEFHSSPGVVRFEIEHDELRVILTGWVDPIVPAECRTIEIHNLSPRAREIELTGAAEIVLHHAAADAAHPGFSKLFVQTRWNGELDALIANRRPRDAGERFPRLLFALDGPGRLSFDSDRAKFLGRGRGWRRPAALSDAAALSGTTGNVLDPVLALRRRARLEAGAHAIWHSLLIVGTDSEPAEALLSRLRSRGALESSRNGAARAASELRAESPNEDLAREAAWEFLARLERETKDGFASPSTPATEAGPVASPAEADRSAPPADADRTAPPGPPDPPRDPGRGLLDFNGYGGFHPDGDAYVIRIGRDAHGVPMLPPAPWVNVIANPEFGCLVSETGAGFTWSGNSREHRLTHWSNDPVLDPHSESLIVHDLASGRRWSPQPGPLLPGAEVEVVHRPGASSWSMEGHGLRHRTTVFVPPDAPVRIARVEIENRGEAPRRLRVSQELRFVLGNVPDAPGVVTTCDTESGVVRAHRPSDAGAGGATAWLSAVSPEGVALHAAARGAAARVEVEIEVPAGATRTVTFLLGEEPDESAVRRRLAALRAPGAIEAALEAALSRWRKLGSRLRIRTPEPALDRMVNHWLPYQNLSCRIWGRSAFYQSGGAFGFRDQLQDASALVWLEPRLTREQILLHAAHQFVEGDVLHWWHPPRSRGIRTRFADDLLWLPWIAAFYVRTSGDQTVLDEEARFLTAPALEPGEQERYLEPRDSGERASVYEHAARAIDRSLGTGAHGFPLFGCGDWNDGMNRVGADGRGESVWMAFFLHAAIDGLAPHAERRGDSTRLARWREHQRALAIALETAGWDGEWYRRGFFGDGTPLGSAASRECRIDALAQAWSVISGAVPRERAEIAMRAAVRELVSERDGLARLLAPPFENSAHDPGYIQGYVSGVRENGGQYTHAALWLVRAMAELGWRNQAARTLAMMSPVWHGGSRESIERYRIEPYVIAADVYGAPPHVGRGGWSWYTGSAGWMYRVALESILGWNVVGGEWLELRPCLPDDWPEASVEWRVPGSGATLRVVYRNPGRCAEAIRSAALDGTPLEVEGGVARVPIPRDGGVHDVVVTLGRLQAPESRPETGASPPARREAGA